MNPRGQVNLSSPWHAEHTALFPELAHSDREPRTGSSTPRTA
jgi:hypothetical protein